MFIISSCFIALLQFLSFLKMEPYMWPSLALLFSPGHLLFLQPGALFAWIYRTFSLISVSYLHICHLNGKAFPERFPTPIIFPYLFFTSSIYHYIKVQGMFVCLFHCLILCFVTCYILKNHETGMWMCKSGSKNKSPNWIEIWESSA